MMLADFYRNWVSPQRWCERIGLRPAVQVVMGLVLLTAATLLVAQSLGLFPELDEAEIDRRSVIAQMAGMQIATAVTASDEGALERTLGEIVERFPEVRSAGVRDRSGKLLAQTPGHAALWSNATPANSPAFVRIPLLKDGAPCGQTEFCFEPLPDLLAGSPWWQSPTVRLMAFVLAGVALLDWIFLARMLRELDPSGAVPERMQLLLDTMVEGAVILDDHESIVMANQAFVGIAFASMDRLIGRKLSSFPWLAQGEDEPPEVLPWKRVGQMAIQQRGILLRLKIGVWHARSLSVNASPILSADGKHRGALVTFSDLTIVEAENVELARTLSSVSNAQTKVLQLQGLVDSAVDTADSRPSRANAKTV